MQSFVTRSAALACALALAACTSMNVVSDRNATPGQDTPVVTSAVHVNDQVRATTLDGKTHLLRVTSVSDTALAGLSEGSTAEATIPVDQVARIERRDSAPVKTTLVVVGTTALVLYTIAALALIILIAH